MAMNERSTVVGVFTQDSYANLAVDELRQVGLSDNEISVFRHKDEAGTLAGLKNLANSQETTPEATADDFTRMGVPDRDAHYYQSELDAGHTIVVVKAAAQEQQVLEIFQKYGGMTTRHSGPNTQAETDPSPVAPDMYDPVANRDASDSTMIPEDPR